MPNPHTFTGDPKIAEHIRKYEDRQPVQPQERWLTSKEVTALLGISSAQVSVAKMN